MVLLGSEEFWRYGPAFSKFATEMKEFVESRKVNYPSNAKNT